MKEKDHELDDLRNALVRKKMTSGKIEDTNFLKGLDNQGYPMNHGSFSHNLYSSLLPMIKEIHTHFSEVKKNSQILSQANRVGSNFFATLPVEILINIASLIGSNENKIEEDKEAHEIASQNFGRPK